MGDAGNASGLNTGDKITIVFDRHTNVPAVSTKSDVDAVFAFGATLGTTYVGSWLSLSVLELELTNVYNRFDDDHTSLNYADISSTAPYKDTKVGTLIVTVKAGGYLQSADLSSVHSTSSDVLVGSWGDHSAPEIVSVTAAEGGENEAGIGIGDTITVVFDKQTTLQAVDTKIGVDELFMFSSYLGDDYSGVWTSYTTVKIMLVDVTHAAAEELTRVGVLRLTVKSAYVLQSADESSPVSTSTGVLGGTWGDHSAPVIVSCDASDDGSQEGIGNGDVITVVFDQDTNSPAIATKADVDAVFNFTDPVGSEVSLGADYTGAYDWEPLAATVAVVTNHTDVGCAVDLSTTIFVGDEIKIGGVVYVVAATPTPSPTLFPTPAPTPTPTPAPTADPTSTFVPTPSPTPSPTAAPSASPSSVPTAAPTKLVANPNLSCDQAIGCTCAACCNTYLEQNQDQCAACVLSACTDAPTAAPSVAPTH